MSRQAGGEVQTERQRGAGQKRCSVGMIVDGFPTPDGAMAPGVPVMSSHEFRRDDAGPFRPARQNKHPHPSCQG